MRGTKEFEDLQKQFEKDIKEITYGRTIEREQKSDNLPSDVFYTDGYINQMFRAYMLGYANRATL